MPPETNGRLIEPARLRTLLGAAAGRFDVDSLAECESTNTELLARAERGAPSGSVLVADRQTAGRGSRGRTWLASPEASLTFSLLWRFDGGLERMSGLSLAVGLAVVEAVKCPEGLRERRSDEGAELAQVAHFDTEMPQGVLHRTGDALHRVCERAVEVEQQMSVFFRHCMEIVV